MPQLCEPVRRPTSSLSSEQITLSEQLAPRLRRMHRFCHFMHTRMPLALSHLARRVAKALLPPLRESMLTPTVHGFNLCVSQNTGINYYYQGFYELGTLDVIRRCLAPGDTFVDAGASVGLMTMMASVTVGPTGRVLSFEPHLGRYHDLLNTVAANDCINVACFNMGLGDVDGIASLYTDLASPSMVAHDREGSRTVDVPVARLDDVLNREGIGSVQMMKVDVEGFEARVLEGARGLLSRPDPPVLCIEHGVYEGGDDVFSLLEQLHPYHVFQLAGTKARVSALRRIKDPRRIRPHDNLFFIPESKLASLGLEGRPPGP